MKIEEKSSSDKIKDKIAAMTKLRIISKPSVEKSEEISKKESPITFIKPAPEITSTTSTTVRPGYIYSLDKKEAIGTRYRFLSNRRKNVYRQYLNRITTMSTTTTTITTTTTKKWKPTSTKRPFMRYTNRPLVNHTKSFSPVLTILTPPADIFRGS